MTYYLYSFFLLILGCVSMGLSLFFYSSDFIYLVSVSFLSFIYQAHLDWISLSFLFLVSLISSQVLIYSIYYMGEEVFYERFKYLLLLFVFSMAFLIVSSDGLSLLLGWDGLGVTSYALILFYSNPKSSSSGMITALSNRVGDILILWSLGLSYVLGSWDYMFISIESSYLVIVLLFLASLTKSAQIPFSAWLPAAMAAPTPVSSLVHSSTLVTAGVFLMIRLSPSFSHTGNFLLILLGSMTALLSGLVAMAEYDFKRIIALSTLSQLGVMMFSLGIGCPLLCYFHLFAHALFKALLFMCSGVIIHSSGGTQDIRRLGSISSLLPFSCLALSVASLSLMGFPFLAGFYSKDMIIESSSMELLLFPSLAILVAALLTCSYSFRLMSVSLTSFSCNWVSFIKGDEGDYTIPLGTLYSGALFGGVLFYWSFLGMESLLVSSLEKFSLLVCLSVGIYTGLNMTLNKGFMFDFLCTMAFLPSLTFLLGFPYLKSGDIIYNQGDQGWVEYLGPSIQSTSITYLSSMNDIFMSVGFKLLLLVSFTGIWLI
uniref:NADH-ubiquinone oxidoreductase chain 5 n=1 Tax=Eubranchipus grubii TaxID=381661 RepID=A0A7D7FAJ6_9CRUS|nr:NADH dehydrogenase subunit 5 [Eubranchipus grubii]QMP96522.1 NADH dehydrogenase subunit 5 [Eubranchipus grubii]